MYHSKWKCHHWHGSVSNVHLDLWKQQILHNQDMLPFERRNFSHEQSIYPIFQEFLHGNHFWHSYIDKVWVQTKTPWVQGLWKKPKNFDFCSHVEREDILVHSTFHTKYFCKRNNTWLLFQALARSDIFCKLTYSWKPP